MTGLRKSEDAYGRQIKKHLESGTFEVIERDDGLIETYSSAYLYAPFRLWPPPEKKAIRLARGRVLDVGARAGRVSLYLQDKGHDVVAIDNSAGAIETCRERGVKDARVLPFEKVDQKLGTLDTVVMFGNNFGLFGSPTRAKTLLRRLHKMTSEDARIIGETLDPYDTTDPDHLGYHRLNRKRGRMPGQLRLRARHRKLVTPWFDYLFVSREEMEKLTRDTGWHVERFIEPTGAQYVGVLEKD